MPGLDSKPGRYSNLGGVGLTGLLGDLIHEADSVDCRRMALGLEAVGALTQVGVRCTTEAHARLCWKEACVGAGSKVDDG